MAGGHHGPGDHDGPSSSSHDPGHHSLQNNHEGGNDDSRHDKHHIDHTHHSDPSEDIPETGPQDPDTPRRWRRSLYEAEYAAAEAEERDPEQQPLLTTRSRRRVTPGPIVAVLTLIVLIGVLQIVIVTIRSDDGYTGSGDAFV
ncbi:hypothetical protein B0J12DRAFT_735691 [Macrophomina phaseolina]|uniref:Uncharacterized protein n=1 Tax=Macrophomina phaseolina TaxID=35725 RepID=A0ABQ8GPJ9_9PEZI|nr:hypothetical protein B0J12DRAFT_735691 [Macrophomina phaseolina]